MNDVTATNQRPRKVTKELILEISAAFNSRDIDKIMSYFAEDCTFYMASSPEPVGRTVHGKAAVHKILADRFKVIPNMRWEHESEYVCGDLAVSVWRVKGKSKDGTVLDYQGCDLWEFKDGLVYKKNTFWKIVQK